MADNISIKLNLKKLAGATVMPVGKNNTQCIVIPIEMNSLYVGNDSVYLDLSAMAFNNSKPDSKDTHLVKQSLPKDKYAAMTEEQRKAMPILGNAIDWAKGSTNSGVSSSTPAQTAAPDWL